MKQLLVATNNPKKAAELHTLLSPLNINLLTLAQAGITEEVEETGTTFSANAFLKANAAHTVTGMPSLADDSGLCVEALNNAPGVYSARYGAPQAKTDADRNAYLLAQMQNQSNRNCAFVCVMCLILPNREPLYFEGRCFGDLLSTPRGNNGFGYDPLFYLPEHQKTMAELPPEQKNQISHRAKAMAQVVDHLKLLFPPQAEIAKDKN